MPHPGRSITETERKLFRRLPSLQLLVRAAIYWGRETFVMPFMHPPLGKLPERIALRHMRRQVPDTKLREKLEPDYKIGCKRILPSNDYYPALTEPNVELVTDPIRSVRSSSIVTEDGTEREVDTIIFGTGFRVTDMPVADHIRGRSGTRLADVWHKSPQAYLGTSIAGFPNLFMLIGPNTGLGHNSMVFMIESQLNYIMDCLNYLDSHDLEAVEVRESAQAAFNQQVQGDLKDTVWTVGGCSSWYLDHTGRNTTLWPGFTWRFRRQTRRFDASQYITEPSANGSGPQRMKSSKQAATKRQKPLARRVLASAGGLALAGTLAALAADRLRR
jgi:cation diffusion facilitator CzcD-associated flavoprotein CzcO